MSASDCSGVSLAFGLTVLTMAYAIGHVSGCHLNPAVSIGLWVGGRFEAGKVIPYIVAQVLGAIVGRGSSSTSSPAARWCRRVRRGSASPTASRPMAMGSTRPATTRSLAGFVSEVVMTFFFLFVILGATHGKAPVGGAPIAIGLCLTLIHLISIPVTNTSVNPARSTSQALFVGGWALSQLWMFWVAPILGAVIGGLVYRWVGEARDEPISGDLPRP